MTNTEPGAVPTAATAGALDAQGTPQKATATTKKGAPKGRKAARKPATSKAAKPDTKTATKKATKVENAIPRHYSKKAIIIDLLRRKDGASLGEITKMTEWQPHSVRGLLSTLRSKSGLVIERIERPDGGRAYHLAVGAAK